MFSHVHIGTRDFGRAWAFDRLTACLLCALAAVGIGGRAQASSFVTQVGTLDFAPGATALPAQQRERLDLWLPRHRPLCVVVSVRRSGGPVTELTALEAARVAYVTQLFSMRAVAVLAAGIGWRRPDHLTESAWVHAVDWGEARCPGEAAPTPDRTQPQP